MKAVKNPFRPTRFEHHDHPLIWISPDVQQLEGLKSVYVAGTRGSGKTSLLKAVNWRERVYNPTVRDQLGEGSSPDYVAVYFRLPDYLTGALGLVDWAKAFPRSGTPDTLGYELFAQLVEYAAAELVCEAVASLRSFGRFAYDFNLESAAVTRILKREPLIATIAGDKCNGLDELSLVFRQLHRRINVSITRGDLGSALELVLPSQPGTFINDLANELRTLACSTDGACSPDFHIKICIDDCETLDGAQQRYLNTLVRNSRHPLFWVVSYVSVDYDSTNTVQNNQTLSDADRTQLHLDEMDNKAFFRLCENVSLLRIYYSSPSTDFGQLKDLPRNFFSLRGLLGTLSINAFLVGAAESSLSGDFEQLIRRSRAVSGRRRRDPPPVYETYVRDRLGGRLQDDRDENVEPYMRRKQVAALLAICSEFRISKPPLIGASAIVSMSDSCIRDYLEIIGSIFDEAISRGEIKSAVDLVSRDRTLSLDTQREGVRSSSEAKFNGIRNSLEKNWLEATRAIEFIGKLTSRLQVNNASLAALATPERGNFIFDIGALGPNEGSSGERRSLILDLLRRCEADGLLRPLSSGSGDEELEGGELVFHLHRRFAAYFNFSYRGPYGLTRMPMAEFAEACSVATDAAIEDCVARAYGVIQREYGAIDQPRLF